MLILSQVLLFEPHKKKRNEFVYLPSYIAFHDIEQVDTDIEDVEEVSCWLTE